MNDVHTLLVKHLGRVEYEPTWRAMQQFTESREQGSTSEAWIVEHPPVFTQGQAGKPEHILAVKEIPVVQSDRGGQVTYHGPGQVVIYLLLNLRDTGMGIRGLWSSSSAASSSRAERISVTTCLECVQDLLGH